MKKIIGGILLAGIIGILATDIEVFSEERESEKEIKITYWGWDSNYYQPMIEAYKEVKPNVTIEVTSVEWWDMLTKAKQALASSSELPTIIPMDITMMENWKKMDIMENLLNYGLDTGNYNEMMIQAVTEDGKVLGIFENICPAGIAYKRDLAEKYLGTDDPDEVGKMFQTYEDYIEKGKEVSEKSNGEVFLFHSGQAVAEWLYFASDIENLEGNTINMTEKMKEIMGVLIALRDVGAVDSYLNGTGYANATYTDKTHIFYPCPDWALTFYLECNDPDGSGNWGLIKAPKGYSHGGTAMGISSYATEEQKKAAYDFIIWCISSEEGATVAKNTAGYITSDINIATKEFCKRSDEDFFGGQDISELYYQDIAQNISIKNPTLYDNDIVMTRNDVAQQIMDDISMTLDDAVFAAVRELEQLVADDDIIVK